jgi:hypothetical protein
MNQFRSIYKQVYQKKYQADLKEWQGKDPLSKPGPAGELGGDYWRSFGR